MFHLGPYNGIDWLYTTINWIYFDIVGIHDEISYYFHNLEKGNI